jgi:hypothetical protein
MMCLHLALRGRGPAAILLLLGLQSARATPNYVYHEQTSNVVLPCGAGVYMAPLKPLGNQAVTIRYKVEYEYWWNQAAVYYTTDGSAPSGAFGVGAGTTQVLAAAWDCKDAGVDVVYATIPGQPAGTRVKYILSAWHSGGGPEIFANGPGPDCHCGEPTDTAAEATVFSYDVPKVVISQVYANGGDLSAPFKYDFVELHNASPFAVDLSGWSLQFAGANGSSWGNRTDLGGTMAPGGYLLVKEAGGLKGADLPAPDITGNIVLAGVGGKVALVASTAPLSGSDPSSDATVVDFLGYGPSTGYEGSPEPTALSATTAAHRKFGGLQDTNNNEADFRVMAPLPRNSAMGAMRGLSIGATTESSPVAFGGKVWLGADDGQLRGYDLATMTMLPGFPYDTRAWDSSTTRKLLGRPALRLENGVPCLYGVSDDGWAFKVNAATGAEIWRTGQLVPGASAVATTPAVTTTDDPAYGMREYVFVAVHGTDGARVCKIVASGAGAGTVVSASLVLGGKAQSSPAAHPSGIFVGVSFGAENGVLRLSPVSLEPLTRFQAWSSVASSPFVYGPSGTTRQYPVTFVGNLSGEILALNATNGNPADGFGSDGVASVVGGAGVTELYVYANRIYAGTASDRVYAVPADTGASGTLVYDGTFVNSCEIAGIAVDPGGSGGAGSLCTCSTNGSFTQRTLSGAALNEVHSDKPSSSAPSGTPFTATPTIDTANGWVVAVNRNGTLLRLPRF